MTQNNKIICIFGGSGFIGQNIVQELARAGYRLKIATRIPECAYQLKTYGNVGQITPFYCDYKNKDSIESVIQGSDIVINLVGILFEKRKNRFMRVHNDLPKTIAEICANKKIEKFIHVSALGVDKAKSKYAKSKLAGEKSARAAFPSTIILRPSVVFGAGDSFFNMFAKMALYFPALPLIGGGHTKFQPVFVGDIANAVANIVNNNAHEMAGKTYQLAGPEVVSFKEIYAILFQEINRKKILINLPWIVAKIEGSFLSLLPKPPLTRDQVNTLKTDNIKDDGALGLEDLGVTPTAMAVILPQYLSNYKKGGPFANKKAA